MYSAAVKKMYTKKSLKKQQFWERKDLLRTLESTLYFNGMKCQLISKIDG